MKMKMTIMFKSSSVALSAAALLFSVACSDDPEGPTPFHDPPELVASQARVTYANIVLASYEDSLGAAASLDDELDALVGDPSADTLEAARQAWLDSREPYLQTEVYRFYGGPIDDDDGPEGLMNAWPIDENYIDYVTTDPTAGIVNDPDQEITTESLAEANEAVDEKSISTGFHALEFLLWGQDLSTDGPGDRPHTDYVTDGSGTAENQDRRGEYLLTASELLLENLTGLVDDWRSGDSSNYRADFLDVDPMESLQRIMTGLILLSGNETGGERLRAAWMTGEQEDEHSCFSDNTHRDMIQDIQGVQNVWLGTYTRLDGDVIEGTGVDEVVSSVDEALAHEIEHQIEECLELANDLQVPFDQEIATDNPEGRDRVEALFLALGELSDLFADAFKALDLDVPEPPA